MDRIYAGSNKGKPKAYSIIGNNIQLRPLPDSAYEIEMLYYKYFTPLCTVSLGQPVEPSKMMSGGCQLWLAFD